MSQALKVVEMFPAAAKVADDEAEWLEAFNEDFWASYPRRVDKFDARRAWLKIRPRTQEQLDEIMAGLARWLVYWRDGAKDKDFIPYPSSWLNKHRWEDEP